MSAKKNTTPIPGTEDNPRIAHEIYDTSIDSFIAQKVVPYFVYTVTDRAVPSVVDGLKKGQRRLLYSAYESGITPDAKPRKSARVVSDATGKYHPHGQTAMYDTLSTLAHTYGRLPLIQGMGSFGMNPGDPAASERYTEARLADAGMEVVRDMKDKPVTMLRTYDGTNIEPEFLPSRFPVAPLTGSEGIAAGFSVTIPSHNPIEFLTLTRALLANPDLTTDKMMEIMPGPDWGTGASVIASRDAIATYYDTGSAHLTVRSRLDNIDGDVVLKEIAPGIGLRTVLGKIRDKIRAGEITTLSGAEDHSDMDKGTHVVFTLKRGKKFDDAVRELYTTTELESTYAVNMVFTDRDNIPRTWGIRDVISQFLSLRDEVLIARSTAALETATTKLQRAEAVKSVVLDKDTTVRLITEAADRAAANTALANHFDLNDEQAHYVTSLALYRLTKADVVDAQREVDQLTADIDRLNKLINSSELRAKELDKELEDSITVFVKDGRYARKTRIDNNAQPTATPATRTDTTPQLHMWKLDTDLGLVSDSGSPIAEGDVIWAAFSDGRIKLFAGDGLPKRMAPTPIAPDVSDMVACGTLTPGDDRLLLVTSAGKVLALDTDSINPQGKAGRGVAGIKLVDDSVLAAALTAREGDHLYTQSVDGWKITNTDDINSKGRGSQGVGVHKLRKDDPAVTSAAVAASFSSQGKQLSSTPPARATNRGTVELD